MIDLTTSFLGFVIILNVSERGRTEGREISKVLTGFVSKTWFAFVRSSHGS